MQDRAVLQAASISDEATSIIRFKSGVPFANITKVWDSERQRIITGDDVPRVVGLEAAKRHPPVPRPLTREWVHSHVGPTVEEATEHTTQVQQACRLQAHRLSKGRIWDGTLYPVNAVEYLRILKDIHSSTGVMDWHAPRLAKQYGLFTSYQHQHMLTENIHDLPEEVHKYVHAPITKKPRADINRCTRPILIGSGLQRDRQKLAARRLQWVTTPAQFQNMQQAVYKGATPAQMRRLIYTIQLQHVEEEKTLASLKGDQSNAYGQTDLGGLEMQTENDPILNPAMKQARHQYAQAKAYVVTAKGMSPPYHLGSGLIQGGGMDPYWYVHYTNLLLSDVERKSVGVTVHMATEDIVIKSQLTVDDILHMANGVPVLESEANGMVETMRHINGKPDPDKFGLLVYAKKREGMVVEKAQVNIQGQSITAVGPKEYFKLVGGNVNILSNPKEDLEELKTGCRRLKQRMSTQPCSIPMMRAILDGTQTMRWVFRRIVDWPQDILSNAAHKGETTMVVSAVAAVARRALYLPLKTPRAFIYGEVGEGNLGVPHPGEKLWGAAVSELIKGLQSPHKWVRGTTAREMDRPPHHSCKSLRGVNKVSDYEKLKQWMQGVGWEMQHYENEMAGRWQQDLPSFRTAYAAILVVADCAMHPSQPDVWGLGGVAATAEGEILGRYRATVMAHCANTTLMETTGVAELLDSVQNALIKQHRSDLKVWPWCDNKSGAEQSNDRNILQNLYTVQGRVLSHLEILHHRNEFQCGWMPAEHDTKAVGLLSKLNKIADEEAECGVQGEQSKKWKVPHTWLDGDTRLLSIKGAVIVNVKDAARRVYQWHDVTQREGEEISPYKFWSWWQAAGESKKMWTHWCPLHPHITARIMMTARYHSWDEFYIGDEGQGTCQLCGQQYRSKECHQYRDCPALWAMIPDIMNDMVTFIASKARKGVTTVPTWGGLCVQRANTEVPIRWCHPKWIEAEDMKLRVQAGHMPTAFGLLPPREAMTNLQTLLETPAALIAARLTTCMSTVQQEVSHRGVQAPLPDLHEWWMNDRDLRADPRIAWTAPHQPHILIPAPILYTIAACLVRGQGGKIRVVPRKSGWSMVALGQARDGHRGHKQVGWSRQGIRDWDQYGVVVGNRILSQSEKNQAEHQGVKIIRLQHAKQKCWVAAQEEQPIVVPQWQHILRCRHS